MGEPRIVIPRVGGPRIVIPADQLNIGKSACSDASKLSKAPRVRTMPIIGDQPNTKSPMKKRTAVTMNPLGADTSKHSTFAVNP